MFVYGGRGDGPMSGRFSLVEHGNIINIGVHGFFLHSQGIKRSYAFGICFLKAAMLACPYHTSIHLTFALRMSRMAFSHE